MNPAIQPMPRTEPFYMMQFALQMATVQAIAEYGGRARIAFLGDSITSGWAGRPSWEKEWRPRKSLNLGIGGDSTGHLLLRLQAGLIRPIQLDAAVQLIGANNLWGQPEPQSIAAGVDACLAEVRRCQPDARILSLGILPMTGSAEVFDELTSRVNRCLPVIAASHHADFLDLRPHFFDNGKIRTELFTPDGIHLQAIAYDQVLTPAVLHWFEKK